MASHEVKVPDIGNCSGVPVIEVLVKVGDSVAKDQGLVTLESDKATMEVPSSVAGVVKEIKVKLGDEISEGHVVALDYLVKHPGLLSVNLGTGCGYSVLDMVRSFEKACGRPVPYAIMLRRPGDVAACYADPSLARNLLGWSAKRGIDEMCRDAWRWQQIQSGS